MKRGISLALSLIVALVILLVSTILYAEVIRQTAKHVDRTANVNVVRTWVLVSAGAEKLSPERAGTDRPKVPDLGGPIKIEDEKDLETTHKQIADAMYDCWSAFDRGETDFLQAVVSTKFCYPCVSILIDDKLKNKGHKIVGLQNYLATTKVQPTKDAPTYLEFLTNEKSVAPDVQDELVINDDGFVFLRATGGRDWKDIGLTVLGLDEIGLSADDSAVEDAFRTVALAEVGKSVILRGATRTAATQEAVEVAAKVVADPKQLSFAFVELGEKSILRKAAGTAGTVAAAPFKVAGFAGKTLGRTVLKFVPGIGTAITVGEVVWGAGKVVAGKRKFNAIVAIDEPAMMNQACRND